MHADRTRPGHSRGINFSSLITGLWVIFVAYWFVAAASTKRSAAGTWWKGAIFRAAIVAGIFLLVREWFREHGGGHVPHAVTTVGPIAASAGVVICALGIGFAIWARTHLGRNWGMPMSLREGHELVTTGPYAFVRHPIYTGILLAAAGTMLVKGFPWLVLLAAFLAYFVYAAKVEERSMLRQFPNDYPGYMNRTKMLIPLLF